MATKDDSKRAPEGVLNHGFLNQRVLNQSILKQVEKADDSILFTSLVASFFHLFSSFLSCLSFLCLFLSFLFSSLFSSLSQLSGLFFSSLSRVPSLNLEPSKPGLEGVEKAAPKPADKKEGAEKGTDKKEAPKDAPKDAPKEAPKDASKEGDKAAEKKAADKGADKKEPPKEPEKKDTTVEMKVPICESCKDLVRIPLSKMAGVKSVECDTYREKVTVVASTAAPADVLIECVKVFSNSRMWRPND